MNKNSCLIFLLANVMAFGGCTTLVSAAREEPIATDPAQRTLGTRIDDSRLETVVGVNINKAHPDLNSARVKVDAFNGVILLSGEVPTDAMRELAGRTAREVANVRQVHNELSVRPNTSTISRVNDGYLRSRVNFRLLRENSLEGTRIHIIVTDGTVYLMGLVTPEQGDAAAHAASLTGGVSRVVKAFEYLDS